MRQKRSNKRVTRAKTAVGAAAVGMLSFGAYQLHNAYSLADHLNSVLLSHEFFRQAIPLGTVLAGAISAIVVWSLFRMHGEELGKYAESVVSYLRSNRKTYGQFGAALLVAIAAIGILSFAQHIGLRTSQSVKVLDAPSRKISEVQKLWTPPKDQSASRVAENAPLNVDAVAEIVPPNSKRLLPKFAEAYPKPRNDYCLSGAPFNLEACEAYLSKNPNELGQGGQRYKILKQVGDELILVPIPWPPLPKNRPSIDSEKVSAD